jgi:hypothetical protein
MAYGAEFLGVERGADVEALAENLDVEFDGV